MPTSWPTSLPPSLRPILHPDLPSSANLTNIANIVIFLPGLGDTSTNFSSFARALNLPSTLTLTLQPPIPIPIPDAGSHWAEDLVLDTSTGLIDPDGAPLTNSVKLLAEDVIKEVIINKCGFKPREMMLFGYGQGASVALATLLHPSISSLELGGVVAIGGLMPISQSSVNQVKSRTPVLVLGGSKGVLGQDNESSVKRTQDAFNLIEIHQWKKTDDSMPKNREEAAPMMAFFARGLRTRVPKGTVEIG